LFTNWRKARSYSIVAGRDPQGENFIKQVPELIRNLCVRFDIGYSKDSVQLIYALDAKISQLRRAEKEKILDEHLIALMAVIGQAVIDEFGGERQMRMSSDGETLEPVVLVQRHAYNPAPYLWEDFRGSDVKPLARTYEFLSREIRNLSIKRDPS